MQHQRLSEPVPRGHVQPGVELEALRQRPPRAGRNVLGKGGDCAPLPLLARRSAGDEPETSLQEGAGALESPRPGRGGRAGHAGRPRCRGASRAPPRGGLGAAGRSATLPPTISGRPSTSVTTSSRSLAGEGIARASPVERLYLRREETGAGRPQEYLESARQGHLAGGPEGLRVPAVAEAEKQPRRASRLRTLPARGASRAPPRLARPSPCWRRSLQAFLEEPDSDLALTRPPPHEPRPGGRGSRRAPGPLPRLLGQKGGEGRAAVPAPCPQDRARRDPAPRIAPSASGEGSAPCAVGTPRVISPGRAG